MSRKWALIDLDEVTNNRPWNFNVQLLQEIIF